ncbi:hypothetical protein FM101_06905 [Arthrobacter rhombi]|uniref:Uncharacterized protein n=3 Tax=Micrococcaceae TaxID=1268 RepID=A0A1R4G099_9MICC|nr:hypothetical protein FM101_06905 [Arthrobacter rhombi]
MPRLGLYLCFVVGSLLVGIGLKWAGRRGPLEAGIHVLARSGTA